MQTAPFKKLIWTNHAKNRRDLPWRTTRNIYKIFVSEIMLQQTQVSRVIPKYASFIKRFSTFKSLADAPLRDVLTEWKGLGYNRRALNMKRAAEVIVLDYRGKLPKTPEELMRLPGIGPNTAGSLLAFAHNLPVPFIETNIRSVYLHFYFPNQLKIHDKDVLPLIIKTLDQTNPREWYYALMDYGVLLKSTHINPSRRSLHYTKQSPFKGSNRELRSKILSFILENPKCSVKKISLCTHIPLKKVAKIIEGLTHEGLVQKQGDSYSV